jgi:hypothetical protein
MTGFSLSDLALPERIKTLMSLSQYGRILPVHRIDPATGVCTCGGFVKRKGKTTDIPCHAGKHPNLWKWQVKASSDPKQLANWADKFPGGNFGIVTGELMDSIDVDTKPNVNGLDSLRKLEAEIGIDLMAIAVVVKTGNGIQLWFKHDPAGRLKTGAGIRPGIDIRGGHKGKGLGMAIAPGSKHPNGNIYQIVSGAENGLQTCPEALIQALYKNHQVNPNPNNSLFTVWCGGVGRKGANQTAGEQRFQIVQDAKLTAERRAELDLLQSQLPLFRSTWEMSRATSLRKFREGRNSPSEYEGSIAFFLVWAGWSEQEIMDAICVWRRERGLAAPEYYSRYAITIGKAVAMVTPRASCAAARKLPKGAWRHGYTRNQILGSVIETPRTPKQIADYTGITLATVYVVIGRLRKDGKVIRDRHTYLCAPTAVPWYLQNIPDDAGENTGEDLVAEYEAWIAAGGLDAVEEEIEAPEMVTRPAAAVIKATMPDFDDYVEPELITVGPAPITEEWPFGTRESRAAALDKWEAGWKKETSERLREARKLPNHTSVAQMRRDSRAKGYATRFYPHPCDLDLERLNKRYFDKEDPS